MTVYEEVYEEERGWIFPADTPTLLQWSLSPRCLECLGPLELGETQAVGPLPSDLHIHLTCARCGGMFDWDAIARADQSLDHRPYFVDAEHRAACRRAMISELQRRYR